MNAARVRTRCIKITEQPRISGIVERVYADTRARQALCFYFARNDEHVSKHIKRIATQVGTHGLNSAHDGRVRGIGNVDYTKTVRRRFVREVQQASPAAGHFHREAFAAAGKIDMTHERHVQRFGRKLRIGGAQRCGAQPKCQCKGRNNKQRSFCAVVLQKLRLESIRALPLFRVY
jgi:hypothetical protein